MSIFTITALLGGLAMFLFGMDVMGKANVLNTNAFGLKTLEAFVVVALLYRAASCKLF